MPMRRPAASLALACALWGCGAAAPGPADAGAADAGPEQAVFIALNPDFADYRSWPVVEVAAGRGPAHRVYLNRAPPHGAAAFPMGTIVVKEMGSPVTYDFEVDAMVKRGGGFNETDGGAPGWEFFGLSYLADAGAPYIQWRGPGVWSAGNYAGSSQSCATCHRLSDDNDYVQTPALSLGHF